MNCCTELNMTIYVRMVLQFTHKSNLLVFHEQDPQFYVIFDGFQLPACICEHAYYMYVYAFPFAFMDLIINTA